MKNFILFLLSIAAFVNINAQSDEYFANMLEPGIFGADAGFTYNSSKIQGLRIRSVTTTDVLYIERGIPEITLGLGLTRGIEVGAGTGFRFISGITPGEMGQGNGNGNKKTGNGDMDPVYVYGKFGLSRECGFMPSVVLETDFYIPKTGTKLMKIDDAGFLSELQLYKSIKSSAGIYSSIGAGWDGITTTPVYTLNLAPEYYISDRLNLYLELNGTYVKNYKPDNTLSLGVYWDATDNFSFEGYAGSGFEGPKERLVAGAVFHVSFGVY